ncbi:MAG: T9SS type A sorting domain-containing protein [Lacibacter sp.]
MYKTLLQIFAVAGILLSAAIIQTVQAQSVQTGKSYINISKPGGGTIQNGDELEIRAVIAVSSSSVYFARYNDTIPAGTTYIANSIRFTTNEGMNYGTPLRPTGLLTDAGADDEARYNAGVLRVNVGSLTRTGGQTAAYNAVAAPNTIDILPAASGCRIYNNGRPSFYGGTCIIMITYHVIVNTTAGNIIQIPGGAFRYKTANTFSEATLPSTVRNLNRLQIMVTDPLPICNAVGSNSIAGNGGNFGSGSTQNLSPAPAPGTVVPGYQWRAFAAPSTGPNDSMFTVANNTSPSGSINNNLAYPNSNRLFNLWDIIGDHTNASNPLFGNPATTPGQPGGYMAVVNAAYGINNAVQQTVSGLCPDTYYEFSAWFRNICRRCSCDTSGRGSGTAGFKNYMAPTIPNTNDSAGVLPNLTFQVDGSDYYTTGNLDYNGQWVKKGFLYKTGAAQTSVNIVIRNNAPGGGGNDWVMDDVAFATCLPGLGMRPTNNPVYCLNGQVDMSVAVNSFYSNYLYYQWELSTDGGTTWANAPLSPTPQTFSYTYQSPNYLDTVYYPSLLAGAANSGHKYRIRVATSLTNLTNNSCAAYNNTDVITIGINPACDVLTAALIKFDVKNQSDRAQLQWQTSNMPAGVYYILERSTDGVHFATAGQVNSKDSDLSSVLMYSWTDDAELSSKNYYRLKIVHAAGEAYSYSKVIVLHTMLKDFEMSAVTNPFHDQITAELWSNINRRILIQVMDVSGKVLKEEQRIVLPGLNKLSIQHPATQTAGMYVLKVSTNDGKSLQRLLLSQ